MRFTERSAGLAPCGLYGWNAVRVERVYRLMSHQAQFWSNSPYVWITTVRSLPGSGVATARTLNARLPPS